MPNEQADNKSGNTSIVIMYDVCIVFQKSFTFVSYYLLSIILDRMTK